MYPRTGVARSRGILLISVLAIVLAVLVAFDTGGLRERLFGRSRPQIQSIVVLPLDNLSGDARQDYVADGITDGLSYQLSLIGTFRVIAGDSSGQYKKAVKSLPEIAKELGVDAAIRGAVRVSGDRIRVTVNLSHAPTGRRLWEQAYERDLRDTPILLAQICRAIVAEIGAPLGREQDERLKTTRPVNPRAFDSYLKAAYGGAGSNAETYLRQAIQLDPGFAMPFAVLAGRYYWSNFLPVSPPRETYPRVKAAAQEALRIDPANAPAHYYSALAAMDYDWDFAEAERQFKMNLELRPNCADTHHMYAHFLLSMGRNAEASAETRRALEIDPVDGGLIGCVAWHDVTTGDYDQAEKHVRQAFGMGTEDPLLNLWLGWAHEQRGRFDDAISEFQKAVVASEGSVFYTAALGHAYAVAGKEQAAREVLDRLLARSKTGYVSPYEIAVVYAGLGDRDRAFEWLEKAYDDRASFLPHFRMDPRIWSLRSDQRFQSLLHRMNFPQGGQG